MAIGTSDGQTFNDEFEYAVSQIDWMKKLDPVSGPYNDQPTEAAMDNERTFGFDPDNFKTIMKYQDVGGGTGGTPAKPELSKLKLGQEMDDYNPRPDRFPRDYTIQASNIPRITVTPREEEKKPIIGPESEPSVPPQEAFEVAAQRLAKSVLHESKPERDMPIANAVVRLGSALGEFAKFPGKVMKGEVDIQSPEGREQAAKWAADMALNMVIAPAPLAAKAIDGTLGSIGGIRAKTVNKADYNLAAAMIDKGMPADQVWQATGWYKGADGKMRFEIPTEGAKLKIPDPNKPMTLENAFDFPKLYEAYPQLKEFKFKIDNDMHALGSYHPDEKLIALNLDKLRTFKSNPIDTMLHEVQHAIQDIEKFKGRGTNPQYAYQEFVEQLGRKGYELYKQGNVAGWMEAGLLHSRASAVKDKIGNNLYYKDLGEQEARLVELRKLLPEARRKEVSPAAHQKQLDDAEKAFKDWQRNIDNSQNPKGWGEASAEAAMSTAIVNINK